MLISTSELAELPCFKELFSTEEATIRTRAQLQIDKLLKKITCNNETDEFRLGLEDNDCEECEVKKNKLKEDITRILDEAKLEILSYLQWVASDKDIKKTITVNASDFPDILIDTLREYRTHTFLKDKYTQFYNKKKEELSPNEAIIQMDYSENFKVQNQNEIQSAYYFDTQVSLLGAHILFCLEDGLKKQQSFVILSDITKHDTSTVYTCYQMLTAMKKTLVIQLNGSFLQLDMERMLLMA